MPSVQLADVSTRCSSSPSPSHPAYNSASYPIHNSASPAIDPPTMQPHHQGQVLPMYPANTHTAFHALSVTRQLATTPSSYNWLQQYQKLFILILILNQDYL